MILQFYPQLSDESVSGQDERLSGMYAILCGLGLTIALMLATGTIMHMLETYREKMRLALRGELSPVPDAPPPYVHVRRERVHLAARATLSPLHSAAQAA